jgi:hypothetical protein
MESSSDFVNIADTFSSDLLISSESLVSDNDSDVSPQLEDYLKETESQKKMTLASLNEKIESKTDSIMTYLLDKERRKQQQKDREREAKREKEVIKIQRIQSERERNERILEEISKNMSENFSKLFIDVNQVKQRLVIVEDKQVEINEKMELFDNKIENLNRVTSSLGSKFVEQEMQLCKQINDQNALSKRVEQLEEQVKSRKYFSVFDDKNVDNNSEIESDDMEIRHQNTFKGVHSHLLGDEEFLHDVSEVQKRSLVDPRLKLHHFKIADDEVPSNRKDIRSRINVIPELSRNYVRNKEQNVQVTRNIPVNFPFFSGDVDVEIYKRQCQAIATCNGWTDEELAVQVIANLRGDARDLIALLPTGHEINLGTIWTILSSRFSKIVSTEAAKHQLQSYTQRKGQSLLNLSLEIEKLVSKAYPSADERTREDLAVDHYVKAIGNSSLRFELRLRGPKTLEEARNISEAIFTVLSAERYQRPVQIHRVDTTSSSETESECSHHRGKKRKGNNSRENGSQKSNSHSKS